MAYKIITKLLASKIRPLLGQSIHPAQSAFIPGKNITDNIIVDHKVMHYLNKKNRRARFMAYKVDLAKAYDKVNWNALNEIMRCHDFVKEFIDRILLHIFCFLFGVN